MSYNELEYAKLGTNGFPLNFEPLCAAKFFDSFVDQYASANENVHKERIVENAVDCLQKQEEKRTQDLHEFIDDFIKSQEYRDYVKSKKRIMRRTTAIQCDENDIIVEIKRKEESERYPLTEERRKMFAFKEQFERYAEHQSKLKERRKQERGIQVIKESINAARILFECPSDNKPREKDKLGERLLEYYSSLLGTDLNHFSMKSRTKILERIKDHHRAICSCKERKQRNILKILEKLLFEYKIKKEVMKLKNKTYDYKVKRKERIIKDMEVVGTKIRLIDSEKVSQVIEETEIEVEPPLELEEKGEKRKEKHHKKEKKEKKEKHEKKSKDKPAKQKKEKEKKKGKEDAKFKLPTVPIINPRDKIFGENIDQMLDLIEEFRKFDGQLENRDMLDERHAHFILKDTGLISKPNTILFQNYDVGKIYYKTIVFSNVSPQIRKMRFFKFSFQDDYDEVAFDVEKIGIQKLYTGCHVKFTVNFQPYDSSKSYEGKILFLSYDVRGCEYYQLALDVKCVPKYCKLKIYPNTVEFGRMPIWRAKNFDSFKILKISNEGAKPCTIYIHKIADPLDIEPILSDVLNEDENKENAVPTTDTSSIDSNEQTLRYIEDIIDSVIDNVDNNFYFEESFFNLYGCEEKRIKVFFKNADYIGNYFEQYTLDVYERIQDGNRDVVGCQEISAFAETIGHSLLVEPEILDFGICQINSCYQLNFEVFNSSANTQAVSIRFPCQIADMIQSDVSTIYLPPQGKRVMWFKLHPREYIFKESCTYFDKGTSILEFAIHVYMVSKDYSDHPPVKVPVYAIISSTEDITIMTAPRFSVTNFLDTILVDMKTCSIYETIWTDILLQNNTTVTQVCGFFDIPECATLEPNKGFVKLYPNQQKKFKLYFSPEIRDFPSYSVGSLKNNKFFFKLRIDTISNIGQIRKEIPPKKLKSSIDLMIKELTKKESHVFSMYGIMDELKQEILREISHSMMYRLPSVKVGDSVTATKANSNTNVDVINEMPEIKSVEDNHVHSFEHTILNYQNFVILETNSRKIIWCKVHLKRPFLEFSHQTVEFPDTPCGSYSIMEVQLRAIEREMEVECEDAKTKKQNRLKYTAEFRISGNSPEITVEPKCGMLGAGESVKITLLAKPNVPQNIIDQTAKSIKYSEIYEMKLREYNALHAKKVGKSKNGKNKSKKSKTAKGSKNAKKDSQLKKNDTGKKKDDKKDKGKIGDKEATNDHEQLPDLIITDKELEVGALDLYPAEMVYWRNMEPYFITAKFACRIDYQHEQKFFKNPHWIYLDAICKVIRPDFITNLNLQKVDFGKCMIGLTATKEIMLQNIKYDDIQVQTTILNPVGPFSLPYLRDLMVPPEHSLKLPINFTPASADKTIEYLEIRSNVTVLPLILCGEGIFPAIHITPEFTVFRLETKQNHVAELHLKIDNASESQVDIRLEKLFEIEGRIGNDGKQEPDVQKEVKAGKNKKQKKDKKSKVKEKSPKFSESLTDQELEAIDVGFNRYKGTSHFDLSNTDKYIQIQPNAHVGLTVFFGEPEQLQKRKIDKPKKGKKEKGDKKSEDESKSSKSGDSKKANIVGGKQYITQYNVLVGKTYLKSIILVCTQR